MNSRAIRHINLGLKSGMLILLALMIAACAPVKLDSSEVYKLEQERILTKASEFVDAVPTTVTSFVAERSSGTKHDFFSEGDYWWPNPDDPSGPYIRKDGETNPDNFIKHREALMRFSDITATLTSAYLLTGDEKYAEQAIDHIRAWFVEPATRMNPNLLYGQAIQGRYTGRSIGIIDTIHLVEVAKSIEILEKNNQIALADIQAIEGWFADYLRWLNTHEYGIKEKLHPNNHGITWSMQAAAFANLVDDQETLKWIRQQFKNVYLKDMMNAGGGFDAELARTKPYGYSLFVIDALTAVAELASSPDDNLWVAEVIAADGKPRNLEIAMSFIRPYIKNKDTWPYPKDIQYWDEWPVRHIALLLSAKNLNILDDFVLYSSLEADPKTYEVIRNMPLRHPLLWVN